MYPIAKEFILIIYWFLEDWSKSLLIHEILTPLAAAGISHVLRDVDVRTIINEECRQVYGATYVTDATVCVDTTGGKGTCNVSSDRCDFGRSTK